MAVSISCRRAARVWLAAVALGLVCTGPAAATPFTPIAERPADASRWSREESWFRVDVEALAATLAVAPGAESRAPGLAIDLPRPDGRLETFLVRESVVMAPELAARFPEIRAFVGESRETPAVKIRMEIGPAGFGAMVFDPDGVRMIARDGAYYVSFVRERRPNFSPFRCGVDSDGLDLDRHLARITASGAPQPNATGPTLRTYRTAIAATGEFTQFWGGTVPLGLNGIVQAVNRVNQVYEVDLGIRMVLVANNNLVVYTNGGTDPFTNGDPEALIGQIGPVLNAAIGSANYDLGHVFATNSGGLAGLGVVCGPFKAEGVTGSGAPTGDPFWIDYVAHEIGHQLDAPHTFNGCADNSQRDPGSAFEPGSGSTIMAYAGICGGQDLQPNSDPYFHVRSLAQIHAFTQTGLGSTCGTTSATGNTTPAVAPVGPWTIPARTPFVLAASATDANGDPLTYGWEQYDLGPATSNGGQVSTDTGSGPIIRSFNPTASSMRIVPRLSNLLANTSAFGEILPTTTRTLNFRVTVRDGRGGTQWSGTTAPPIAQAQVNVVGTAGPFRITSQNTATTWTVPSQNLTWDVAGTTAAPISCANVAIALSSDGGNTWPTTLAASTPNDGSQAVSLPTLSTTQGRVRVSCVGNIFFDINDAAITINVTSELIFANSFE
jgi:hypothetical protein